MFRELELEIFGNIDRHRKRPQVRMPPESTDRGMNGVPYVGPARVTGLKQNTASSRGILSTDQCWAPRLAQESRLRQLEDLLARHPIEGDAIDAEIERAVLLSALNRRQDAQQAFIDILR